MTAVQSGPRNGDLAYVSEHRIAKFVNFISIFMAVILLFVAIVTLHLATKASTKLILVGVYMMVFAFAVGSLTAAKRVEVAASSIKH